MLANQYHLVKVLDRKWVQSLIDGDIFFRAVQCFGDICTRTAETNNTFRGDSIEGISITDGENFGLIDALTYREKLYCMYSLDYDVSCGRFVKPDKRLLQFGNTAVIITDSKKFLYRICNALFERYGNDFWVGFDRVHYNVSFDQKQIYNEFSKSLDYSYQNEFRIVLDLANGKFHPKILERVTDFAKLTFPSEIRVDEKPDSLSDSLTINIGNISDICKIVSTEELICKDGLIDSLPVPQPIRPFIPPRKPMPTFFFVAMKLT